jgi:hypothetical protein
MRRGRAPARIQQVSEITPRLVVEAEGVEAEPAQAARGLAERGHVVRGAAVTIERGFAVVAEPIEGGDELRDVRVGGGGVGPVAAEAVNEGKDGAAFAFAVGGPEVGVVLGEGAVGLPGDLFQKVCGGEFDACGGGAAGRGPCRSGGADQEQREKKRAGHAADSGAGGRVADRTLLPPARPGLWTPIVKLDHRSDPM